MKKSRAFILFSICLWIFANRADAAVYATTRACSSGESWALENSIPEDFRAEFKAFLADSKNQAVALRGLSEAIALRKSANTSTEKWFSEYWISRALYSLNVAHIAYTGFLAMAEKTPDLDSMPVHAAALDCLLRLHQQHPSMILPIEALAGLKFEIDQTVPEKILKHTQIVAWDIAVAGIQTLMSDDRIKPQQIQTLLTVLRDGGPYEAFGRGLWSAKQNQHYETIESLKKLFSEKIPDSLTKYEDTAHILLARARYSVGQFDLASDEIKLVSRKSNDLASSLSELAWANLLEERYPEAIGTAMNLEAGGLRHTFTPEAPMVSAMAMNELCQYPDAVREISIFKRNYEKSYKWLTNWVNMESDHSDKLYQQAIQFIRRQNDIPDRVAGEWVRAPIFIATQDEINTLFDERDSIPKVGPVASHEQRTMALEILKHAQELKPKLKIAKMKLKQGEALPRGIRDSLDLLKRQVIHWRRLQLAAPVWVAVSRRFQGTIAPSQARLIARINADLKTRNLRMMTQLEEIAENIQLIEVEIYNGASQDIIWQNAHPDYKGIAKAMKEEHDEVARSKVWDWGRTISSSDESSEIWEDELGSFKANLFDNCSSKDRYLAIRLKRRSGA
jgi:hypothetical protein